MSRRKQEMNNKSRDIFLSIYVHNFWVRFYTHVFIKVADFFFFFLVVAPCPFAKPFMATSFIKLVYKTETLDLYRKAAPTPWIRPPTESSANLREKEEV